MNAIAQKQHGNISSLYFEGNINSYTFADEGASLYDVLYLYNGKPDKIRDKLLKTMKSMRDLEEYIDKTEDNSLRMIVEVVKEFRNKLPGLINQLKESHTATRQEADMVFSTVHRCKGLEYDEVTLLNDFINEAKLTKYIAEMGGDKISVADKNRLAEEINILYVAATRARNKLIIPPDISPLQSIEIATPQQKYISGYRRKNTWADEGYEQLFAPIKNNFKMGVAKNDKSANQGKSWYVEQEEELKNLFETGMSQNDIAKQMQRSRGSIHSRLKKMGLIDDDEDNDE